MERREQHRRSAAPGELREQLRNMYWIGGGSGAGKSTIARRLATQHSLEVYATDDVMSEHAGRASAQDCPLLRRFMAMDMDERWVRRSPEAMLETFHWFDGECFDEIVDDVLQLPKESGVIVEGFRLLPSRVSLFAAERHAVWLLPTPAFRQEVFERRGLTWGFLGKTSDPEKARRNLLERDRMFTDRLKEETKRLGLLTIIVDGTMSEDDLATQVAAIFEL